MPKKPRTITKPFPTLMPTPDDSLDVRFLTMRSTLNALRTYVDTVEVNIRRDYNHFFPVHNDTPTTFPTNLSFQPSQRLLIPHFSTHQSLLIHPSSLLPPTRLPSPPRSPESPLPPHISRILDPQGRIYYVNNLTQTASWTHPPEETQEPGEQGQDGPLFSHEPAPHNLTPYGPRPAQPAHLPAEPFLPWNPLAIGSAPQPDLFLAWSLTPRPSETPRPGLASTERAVPQNPLSIDSATQPILPPAQPLTPRASDTPQPGIPLARDALPRAPRETTADSVFLPPTTPSQPLPPPTPSQSLPHHIALWHDPFGRAIYADHETGATSWLHPGKVTEALRMKRETGRDVREITADGKGMYWVDYEGDRVGEVEPLVEVEMGVERREGGTGKGKGEGENGESVGGEKAKVGSESGKGAEGKEKEDGKRKEKDMGKKWLGM